MKNSHKYLILGGVLLLLVVLMFFINSGSKTTIADKNISVKKDSLVIKKPVNPNGTFLLYQLLRTYKNTASLQKIQTTYSNSLSKLLPKESSNKYPNIYLAITENVYLNESDDNWLLDFVKEGNYAFVSCENLSFNIQNALSDSNSFSFNEYYDTSFVLNFYHPDYFLEKPIEIKNSDLNSHRFPKYKNWAYFINSDLSDSYIRVAFNESEDYPVCIMFKYGKGMFVVHSAPPAFSNFNLLKKEGKFHAETIFSHLPKGNIYWHHDFGKYSPYRGVTQPTSSSQGHSAKPNYPKSSPLQYIMKVPALFAALMLLIIGALLYMLIQSKRRQRIIPAIESNENSSVEFVETVSKLYFQQKRHDKLIKHKELIFLSFLRQQYYISSPEITPEFINKVSQKSGIHKNNVQSIFKGFKQGKTNRYVSDTELISLYNELEHFYKNCN